MTDIVDILSDWPFLLAAAVVLFSWYNLYRITGKIFYDNADSEIRKTGKYLTWTSINIIGWILIFIQMTKLL